MEIKLTTPEIRAILQGCQHTLRLVGSSKDYRRLQSSEYFSTSNDVVLNDAFNVLEDNTRQYNQAGIAIYNRAAASITSSLLSL